MRVLFNAAMRWELISYQLNPMSLVRVKDGSKRKREPKALSADEFRQMFRTHPRTASNDVHRCHVHGTSG
jgi:hypothetical protein